MWTERPTDVLLCSMSGQHSHVQPAWPHPSGQADCSPLLQDADTECPPQLQGATSYSPVDQVDPAPYFSYPLGSQPVTSASTTVVGTQPTAVSTTRIPPLRGKPRRLALSALVLSVITLLCCGPSLVSLYLSIPALILAVAALTTTGPAQMKNAALSISLNVALLVYTAVALIAFIPGYVVNSSSSSP